MKLKNLVTTEQEKLLSEKVSEVQCTVCCSTLLHQESVMEKQKQELNQLQSTVTDKDKEVVTAQPEHSTINN